MPSPNPTLRREYKGAAAATTLQNAMSSSDISFVLVSTNNWPTGSVGKFVVCINRGQADEEKILCDTQMGRTVACQLANRGFDGTTAQGHAAGATVECTISAFDADEWNQHTNATTGVHGVAGAVVGTTDAQTLTNKTLTAPIISTISNTGTLTLPTSTDTLVGRATTDTLTNKTLNGATADAASTIGGVSGTSLAADRTAWTSYTPTFGNITSGAGAFAYKQIGKNLYVRGYFTAGTYTGAGTVTVSLPGGLTSAAGCNQIVAGNGAGNWYVSASTVLTTVGTNPGGTSLAGAYYTGVVEVQ